MGEATITIKSGREKPIIQQHPWIFSGAINSVSGDPNSGDIVAVRGSSGNFLGRGYWNPKSQIQVRLLTWQDEPIDDSWWRKQFEQAIQARASQFDLSNPESACRLINAENDYLPGLIVDKYGEWLILQALTLGIDVRKHIITECLVEILKPQGIYERSDVDVRRKEGLNQVQGVLWGQEPPDYIIIDEGVKIQVDVRKGHKTGFYLDQAPNRQFLAKLVTQFEQKASVLNLFSYTGGFGLHALKHANTSIVNVDVSYEALELAEKNGLLNGFPTESAEYIQADVFEYLRDIAYQGQQHDIVILDPPKFAHNKQQIEQASRGYKDINMNAFKVVKSGGYLMTFSCSGAIDIDLFQKIVFGAMVDSERQAQIITYLGAGVDHPIALTFPEGAYLKGLLLRVY